MPVINEHECIRIISDAGCLPFSFDSDRRLFLAGEAEFRIHDNLEHDMFHALRSASGLYPEDLRPVPLARSYSGEVYALPPMMRAYPTPEAAKKTARSVTKVMRDVFAELTGDTLPQNQFRCWVSPNRPANFRLLGSPELHAMAEGHIGEAGWAFHYYEYGTNNADLPEYEVTLLAGIGHLAALAATG